MVHNGMCSSMDRIKDYKYKGEVDSEILLSYVEKHGIFEGLSYLQGFAAIASINIKKPNSLYLWRHKEDIYLGYDRDKSTLFFCSSENIAETGLANELLLFSTYQIRELPEDDLYNISYNPLSIKDVGEIEIKKIAHKSFYNNWGRKQEEDSAKKVNKWTWSSDLQCLVPSVDESIVDVSVITDKYYFRKQSSDFSNWVRVEKCFVSPDGLLIKMWDKDKATHYIVSLVTAIKEKLIDDETLKAIKEDLVGE